MTAIWNETVHGRIIKDDMAFLSEKAKEYNAPIIIGEYAAFPKKYADFDK